MISYWKDKYIRINFEKYYKNIKKIYKLLKQKRENSILAKSNRWKLFDYKKSENNKKE